MELILANHIRADAIRRVNEPDLNAFNQVQREVFQTLVKVVSRWTTI